MKNKRTMLVLCLFSLIVAVSFAPLVWRFNIQIIIKLTAEVVVFIVAFLLSYLIYRLINKYNFSINKKTLSTKQSLLLLCLIFIPYLLAFICFFPGCGDNDATDIINMVMGMDTYNASFRYEGWNDHHTLMYSVFYLLVLKTGMLITNNIVISVAAINFIQMVIFVFCVYRFVKTLYCNTGYKLVLVLSAIFLTLNPLLLQSAVTLWKDTIFSGCMLVLSGELFALFTDKNYVSKKSNLAIMIISLAVIGLMRKNGLLISLIVCVVLIVKSDKKAVFGIVLGSLFAATLIAVPVKAALNIQSAHFSEAVGVPLQQIANTAKKYGDEEEFNYFDQIIDHNRMAEVYYLLTPDRIKFDPEFNDEVLDNTKLDFLKNYVSLGLKHPYEYIEAWVNQTKVAWSPTLDSWYAFPLINLSTWTNDNALAASTHKLFNSFYSHFNPLLHPSFLLLFTIFAFFVCWIRHDKRKTSLIPCLLLIATLLLSLPATDFRYEMPLFMILPLTVCLLLTVKSRNNGTVR